MKKFLSLALAVLMLVSVFCLAGCGETKKDTLVVYTEAGFAPYEFQYNNDQAQKDFYTLMPVPLLHHPFQQEEAAAVPLQYRPKDKSTLRDIFPAAQNQF